MRFLVYQLSKQQRHQMARINTPWFKRVEAGFEILMNYLDESHI